jgi:Trm5-related predicted tRNA methylase
MSFSLSSGFLIGFITGAKIIKKRVTAKYSPVLNPQTVIRRTIQNRLMTDLG